MRISVTQAEVQHALVAYLEKQGIVVAERNIAVSFSIGRRNNVGLVALVDLEDPTAEALPTTAVDDEEDDQPIAVAAPVVAAPKSVSVGFKPASKPVEPAPAPVEAKAVPAEAVAVEADPVAAVEPTPAEPVQEDPVPDTPFDGGTVVAETPVDPEPEPDPVAAPTVKKSLFAKP